MSRSMYWCALALVAGCGAGETRVDPGDLELRDLLGVSTDVARRWDADQRASARGVLSGALATRADTVELVLEPARALDDRISHAIFVADRARHRAGDDALAIVRVAIAGDRAGDRTIASAPAGDAALGALAGATAPRVELAISDRWQDDLPGRGLELLSAIAADAGHADGPVLISPAPRLAAIATYVDGSRPARLLVNPVVLAALEPVEAVATITPAPGTPSIATAKRAADRGTDETRRPPLPDDTVAHAGNPYSFYGSVNECAAAQRTRCESCLAAGTCEAITRGTDGNTECTTLGANNGRGYFLICINLALAITSVDSCTAEAASGCARDTDAASELGELENNASFLDDATCAAALDGCLAEIYGAPPSPFPGIDGGIAPEPPRSTNVSCSESCESNNTSNCEANGPSCGSGPSCGNSLSCDGACSSSNDQQGCGGNCNACTEDEGGTGGSSGCGGSDSGGGGSCGGDESGGSGCGGGDSGGSCGGDSGGCGGDSSGGGGCGGDSGGSCGGSGGGGCSGGSSGGGGCSGGGGGSSSCNVARRASSNAGATLIVSLAWAMLPIPAAALVRRRARKKPASKRGEEVVR